MIKIFERERAAATRLGRLVGVVVALYARKSTDQDDVSDEQTSVATQLVEGREFTVAEGGVVDDASIFEDAGISGAEYDERPGWMRIMALAESGRARFSVVVVRNLSRVGREWIEALGNLKTLDEAGIQVWTYQDGQLIDMRDPMKVAVIVFQAFAADQQRVAVRKDVSDAMQRKARQGHVISSLPYGYARDEKIVGGKRSHVERQIIATEAPIVRRIYEEYRRGLGKQTIARGLNRDGIPTRGGGRWTVTTIGGILSNPIYRGEIVAHRYRDRTYWGKKIKGKRINRADQRDSRQRPPDEWIRVAAPACRIVSDDLWYAVEARRQQHGAAHAADVAAGKRRGGPPRDRESLYLLSGFAICGSCRGPMCVIRRDVGPNGLLCSTTTPGVERRPFYSCLTYHRHGRSGCANATTVLVERVQVEVLGELRRQLETPRLVERCLDGVVARRSAQASTALVARLRKDIGKAERAVRVLTESLRSARRPVPSIVALVEEEDARLATLRRQYATASAAGPTESAAALRKRALAALRAWLDRLMTEDVADLRVLFREVLNGKIVLTPAHSPKQAAARRHRNQLGPRRDTRAYRFEGRVSLLPLFAGFATSDVRDTAYVSSWERSFNGLAA